MIGRHFTNPRSPAAVVLLLFAALLWWGSVTTAVREGAGRRLDVVAQIHAAAIVSLARIGGFEASAEGTLVRHVPSGFAYNVSAGCTHLPTVLLLVVAVGAVAVPGRAKLVGAALGVPLYIVLNLTRLVHLFAIGVQRPQWFAPAHEIVWPGLLAIAFLAYWIAWRRWADRLQSRDRI